MDRLRRRMADRAQADELQRALEGRSSPGRPGELGRSNEVVRLLDLAQSLHAAAAPRPDPDFAGVLEHRLREAAAGTQVVVRPARLPRWAPILATVTASFVMALAVARGAVVSLPGEFLYPVKDAGRAARLSVAGPQRGALLRVGFAGDRFTEVDKLMARDNVRLVGSAGSVLAAAGVRDAKLAKLIASIVRRAERDLRSAAKVLLSHPEDSSLTKLQAVARRGVATVQKVAPSLADVDQAPMAETAVSLQAIETQAAAERERISTSVSTSPTCEPSPTPSATPSPTPAASSSPSPTPQPTAKPSPTPTPTPSPQASGSPAPEPASSPSPAPDPCASPSPTASPSGSPTPKPAPTASPRIAQSSPTPATAPRPSEPVATEPPASAESKSETAVPATSTSSKSCFILFRILHLC